MLGLTATTHPIWMTSADLRLRVQSTSDERDPRGSTSLRRATTKTSRRQHEGSLEFIAEAGIPSFTRLGIQTGHRTQTRPVWDCQDGLQPDLQSTTPGLFSAARTASPISRMPVPAIPWVTRVNGVRFQGCHDAFSMNGRAHLKVHVGVRKFSLR